MKQTIKLEEVLEFMTKVLKIEPPVALDYKSSAKTKVSDNAKEVPPCSFKVSADKFILNGKDYTTEWKEYLLNKSGVVTSMSL